MDGSKIEFNQGNLILTPDMGFVPESNIEKYDFEKASVQNALPILNRFSPILAKKIEDSHTFNRHSLSKLEKIQFDVAEVFARQSSYEEMKDDFDQACIEQLSDEINSTQKLVMKHYAEIYYSKGYYQDRIGKYGPHYCENLENENGLPPNIDTGKMTIFETLKAIGSLNQDFLLSLNHNDYKDFLLKAHLDNDNAELFLREAVNDPLLAYERKQEQLRIEKEKQEKEKREQARLRDESVTEEQVNDFARELSVPLRIAFLNYGLDEANYGRNVLKDVARLLLVHMPEIRPYLKLSKSYKGDERFGGIKTHDTVLIDGVLVNIANYCKENLILDFDQDYDFSVQEGARYMEAVLNRQKAISDILRKADKPISKSDFTISFPNMHEKDPSQVVEETGEDLSNVNVSEATISSCVSYKDLPEKNEIVRETDVDGFREQIFKTSAITPTRAKSVNINGDTPASNPVKPVKSVAPDNKVANANEAPPSKAKKGFWRKLASVAAAVIGALFFWSSPVDDVKTGGVKVAGASMAFNSVAMDETNDVIEPSVNIPVVLEEAPMQPTQAIPTVHDVSVPAVDSVPSIDPYAPVMMASPTLDVAPLVPVSEPLKISEFSDIPSVVVEYYNQQDLDVPAKVADNVEYLISSIENNDAANTDNASYSLAWAMKSNGDTPEFLQDVFELVDENNTNTYAEEQSRIAMKKWKFTPLS